MGGKYRGITYGREIRECGREIRECGREIYGNNRMWEGNIWE